MREILNFLLMVIPIIVLLLLIRFFSRTLRHPKRIVAESNGMRKISTNPSFFSRSAQQQYFYDSHYLYEVKNDITHKIQLADIVKIKPGLTKVNNRRKWAVIYLKDGKQKQVEFYHNVTFFNHNFADFLAAVKRVNPEAEIKSLSFFNL